MFSRVAKTIGRGTTVHGLMFMGHGLSVLLWSLGETVTLARLNELSLPVLCLSVLLSFRHVTQMAAY